ncbi:hypothetical protein, partial [Acinetobacter baumannii]|uniref:hypothetical protein n=1 Tax=Acinetobacter baumannii TaxID=470 RepID=UPI001BC88C49
MTVWSLFDMSNRGSSRDAAFRRLLGEDLVPDAVPDCGIMGLGRDVTYIGSFLSVLEEEDDSRGGRIRDLSLAEVDGDLRWVIVGISMEPGVGLKCGSRGAC